jgi:ABC-type multidrug transport system ATPase subunit
MNTLDLTSFAQTKAINLSGGNKRKLVCAMSLVGYPEIEFLDEPTTGVDPVSCRSFFKMLKGLKQSSMVLTTHRMDEAESLCDNIAIMINGSFVCYGSPGQLKSTYGKGYTIVLKHYGTADQHLNQYLAQNMPYMQRVSIKQEGATVQNMQATTVGM